MTEYSVSIETEKKPLAGRKVMLDAWVSSCMGFEDPGMFLLHRKRSLVNTDAAPLFETFANPCTLVEYPYRFVERNYGMYRDRAVSILFDDNSATDVFLEKLEDRRVKLLDNMNGMAADIEAAPVETINGVSFRTSSLERNFVMATFTAKDDTPFLFQEDKGFSRFVGIVGDTDLKGVPKGELTVITYRPRFDLFIGLMRQSLANR